MPIDELCSRSSDGFRRFPIKFRPYVRNCKRPNTVIECQSVNSVNEYCVIRVGSGEEWHNTKLYSSCCRCHGVIKLQIIVKVNNMAFPSAKRLGKRIIDYPEETVPVISSPNWLGWFFKDPKQDVSRKFGHIFHILIRPSQIKDYLLSLFPILTWITRYSQLIYRELELRLEMS